jgi:hypothetical protein
LGGRGRRISEFEASLDYRVSSRTARAAQRNPVSKNQKKKKKIYPGGAREMAQQLRALTVLPEVLSSISSNHMVAHTHL